MTVDQFSYAMVLVELATRDKPYKYGDAVFNPTQVIAGRRPAVPADCPPPILRLMKELWSGDPSSRPPFAEVAARLKAMQADGSCVLQQKQQHEGATADATNGDDDRDGNEAGV